MSLRIGDRASARQPERQIAIDEFGDDRGLRCRRNQDRLAGLDRDADRSRKILPELRRSRVSAAPLADNRLDLVVAAGIIRDNATPSSDGAAEPGRELAALAELAFCSRDLGVRRLVQHLTRDHAIRLELLVAGPLEGRIGFKLPMLAGMPGQHDALDRGKVAGLELVTRSGTERRARDVAEQRERISIRRNAGTITAADLIDHGERQVALILLQVLQLRAQARPTTWRAAIHAQRTAH